MTVGQMPPPRGNPLAAACYYDQPDVVKALLASGADPLAGGDRRDFPMSSMADNPGATREIQRRADGGSTAESNVKDLLRRWPNHHSVLNCLGACADYWEAGADILRAREPLDDDPPSIRRFQGSRAATEG